MWAKENAHDGLIVSGGSAAMQAGYLRAYEPVNP